VSGKCVCGHGPRVHEKNPPFHCLSCKEEGAEDPWCPFVPAPAKGAWVNCWCGKPFGHTWPGSDRGFEHPRESA